MTLHAINAGHSMAKLAIEENLKLLTLLVASIQRGDDVLVNGELRLSLEAIERVSNGQPVALKVRGDETNIYFSVIPLAEAQRLAIKEGGMPQ